MNTVTETVARIERVCVESEGNGIYSVGANAALHAMTRHWKDHLGEGHPATIVTADIDGLIEQLQHMKQRLQPAGVNAPDEARSPLKTFDTLDLLDELRLRGQVVSSWGREDLSFLEEAAWTEELTAEQLDALKDLVMEQSGDGLAEILGQRGNDYLSDWCFQEMERLKQEVIKR